MTTTLRCRAVFLDAGGVIVLPDRDLLARALAAVGIEIDPATVPRAHYRAVRTLDRRAHQNYAAALFPQLGIVPGRAAEALAVWERLADRGRSGEVLWREATQGATRAIASLRRAGLSVVVVTNSDGHGEENLRDAEICQVGLGPGAPVSAVIDSTRVGSTKPDPGIFRMALERAGVAPAAAVHVGDMLSTDVAGATAVGIPAVHLDPTRQCRDPSHRHVRALPGLWRHFALARATRHNTSSL